MNQSYKEDINDYIFQAKLRLKNILDRLEWTEEATLKDFNTNSVASAFNAVQKKPRSSVKVTYPDSCISKNSLVLESSKLQEVLQNNEISAPCNFRDLQENFSREQKLKIYEHVIKNTKKLENTTLEPKVEGELSLAEILAQKRREEGRKKRRFRKSKRTHIEEVRCLVNLQMEALQQFVENKIKKERQLTFPGTSTKYYGRRKGDERRNSEDYNRSERTRTKFIEHHAMINDSKRRHRTRSKYYTRDKHKRHERSSSKDKSYTRKSRSKERKRNRSSSKEMHTEGRSYDSNITKDERRQKSRSRSHQEVRKHRKSRSSDDQNRGYNTKILNDIHKLQSIRSYESHTRKGDSDHDQKCSRGNANGSYCEHSHKKYCENYISKEGSSTEASISKRQRQYTFQSNDKHSHHKRSKHKKRKHKRDHS